eukprot:s1718_g14.t1
MTQEPYDPSLSESVQSCPSDHAHHFNRVLRRLDFTRLWASSVNSSGSISHQLSSRPLRGSESLEACLIFQLQILSAVASCGFWRDRAFLASAQENVSGNQRKAVQTASADGSTALVLVAAELATF